MPMPTQPSKVRATVQRGLLFLACLAASLPAPAQTLPGQALYAHGKALGSCQRFGQTCKLYAVDNAVVWRAN